MPGELDDALELDFAPLAAHVGRAQRAREALGRLAQLLLRLRRATPSCEVTARNEPSRALSTSVELRLHLAERVAHRAAAARRRCCRKSCAVLAERVLATAPRTCRAAASATAASAPSARRRPPAASSSALRARARSATSRDCRAHQDDDGQRPRRRSTRATFMTRRQSGSASASDCTPRPVTGQVSRSAVSIYD